MFEEDDSDEDAVEPGDVFDEDTFIEAGRVVSLNAYSRLTIGRMAVELRPMLAGAPSDPVDHFFALKCRCQGRSRWAVI